MRRLKNTAKSHSKDFYAMNAALENLSFLAAVFMNLLGRRQDLNLLSGISIILTKLMQEDMKKGGIEFLP